MDVGRRIRQLRIKNGLTQEELASRCELTKGFLKKHPEFRAPGGEDLAESRMAEQKKALFTDMKNAGESITTLKESWKAMESHTAFSFMNSSEFKKMDIEEFKGVANGAYLNAGAVKLPNQWQAAGYDSSVAFYGDFGSRLILVQETN